MFCQQCILNFSEHILIFGEILAGVDVAKLNRRQSSHYNKHTRHRIWSRHKGNGESQLPLSASNFFHLYGFSRLFLCRIYISAAPFIVLWFSPPIVFARQLPLFGNPQHSHRVIISPGVMARRNERASLSKDRPVAKLTPAGIYTCIIEKVARTWNVRTHYQRATLTCPRPVCI